MSMVHANKLQELALVLVDDPQIIPQSPSLAVQGMLAQKLGSESVIHSCISTCHVRECLSACCLYAGLLSSSAEVTNINHIHSKYASDRPKFIGGKVIIHVVI